MFNKPLVISRLAVRWIDCSIWVHYCIESYIKREQLSTDSTRDEITESLIILLDYHAKEGKIHTYLNLKIE